MSGSPRPVFCGNFEYDASPTEIERLFKKYGKLDRVDMKTGFAFVYMIDDRDAEDAIKDLDGQEFGRQRRRLVVQWAKGDGSIKRREEERKEVAKARPSKTLFVVNFDPAGTRTRDLEKHFEPFGKLVRVQIRKNFAFVQYETQEEATKAVDGLNNRTIDGRVVTVEYAAREDGAPPLGDSRDSPREDRDRETRPRERTDRQGERDDRQDERSDRGRDRGDNRREDRDNRRDDRDNRRDDRDNRRDDRDNRQRPSSRHDSPPRRQRDRSPDYRPYRP